MAKSTKKKRQAIVIAAQGPASGVKKRGRRADAAMLADAGDAWAAKLIPAKRLLDKRPGERAKRLVPPIGAGASDDADRLTRLLAAVLAVRAGKQTSPRTQKLLKSGIPKMAQKLVEEAAETAIDAVRGERIGMINESADLLFNLVVLWSALDVTPADIWAEMDRRELALGLAEKLPKPLEDA